MWRQMVPVRGRGRWAGTSACADLFGKCAHAVFRVLCERLHLACRGRGLGGLFSASRQLGPWWGMLPGQAWLPGVVFLLADWGVCGRPASSLPLHCKGAHTQGSQPVAPQAVGVHCRGGELS